jgi:hypothetical protein
MRIALAFTTALLLPWFLSAQARPRTEAHNSQGDVFIGAAFNGDDASGTSTGVSGGIDFHLLGPLGADAQVGVYSNGTNGTNTITLVDYLFGPRVQVSVSNRAAPFADLLVGG